MWGTEEERGDSVWGEGEVDRSLSCLENVKSKILELLRFKTETFNACGCSRQYYLRPYGAIQIRIRPKR